MLYLYTATASGVTSLVIADTSSATEPGAVKYVELGTDLQAIYDAYHEWAALLMHADGGLNLDGGLADPSGPP